ncbi:MAG: WG repeat-containing protein [Crocinitomicaceae bacterium]|nr:WG repeat-containing protein [Crocinitomicaceae bacterium]
MRLLLLCILFLGGSFLHAQNALPYREGGKWGLISPQKKVILNPVYDFIFNFKDLNYAVFMHHGKYGVVNQKGKEILPPEYNEVKVLNKQFFACQKNGLFEVKNDKGKTFAEGIFKKVTSIGSDLLLAENDTSKLLINTDLEMEYWVNGFQLEVFQNTLILHKPDSCVVINRKLNELAYSSGRYYYYYNNQIFFSTNTLEYRLKDDFQGSFEKDHQPMMNFNLDKSWYVILKNGKYGVFDPLEKKYLLDPEFDWIEWMQGNFYKVKKGDFFGVIDQNGKYFLEAKYNDVFALNNGFYVLNSDYKAGLLSQSGATIIPTQYDWISDETDYYEVFKDAKHGIYSIGGVQIEPPIYDEIRYVEGAFKCYSGPVKNKDGKVIKYKKVVSFSLEGNQVSGRVEFQDVGIINIQDIKSRTRASSNNLTVGVDSIYRWKKEFMKFKDKANEFEIGLWGLRDSAYRSYILKPKYDVIEVFLDRNYTLAGAFSANSKHTLITPFGAIHGPREYEIIDHDNTKRFQKITGYLSLSSVYKNKPALEYFTGKEFVFQSMDTVGALKYTFIDKENEEHVRRISEFGEYVACSPNDQQYIMHSGNFISNIIGNFNDSVPFNKRESAYLDLKFKDTPMKIDHGKWNLIDSEHNKLLKENYDYLENPVRSKYLSVKNGNWGIIAIDTVLLPHQFRELKRMRSKEDSVLISAQKEFQEFIIDSLGNKYEIPNGRTILKREGEAVIYSENGKNGLLNEQLEVLIPADYGRLKHLGHNWYRFRKKGKLGLVHANGNEIPPVFSELTPISESYVLFEQRRKLGVLNHHGDTLIPPKYEKIEFIEDRFVARENGSYFLIDPEILKPKKLKGEFKSQFKNWLIFQNGNALVFYDFQGKLTHKIPNSGFVNCNKDLVHVRSEEGNQFYSDPETLVHTEQGKTDLLTGLYFQKYFDREKVLMKAGVKEEIDKGGIMKISEYGDFLVYKSNGKYRLRNTKTDDRFDFEGNLAKIVSYHQDYFVVQYTDRTMAYVDLEAKPIYNREFEECSPFISGYAIVKEDDETKIFFKDGTMIEGLVYHQIRPLIGGYFKAQILKQYGLVDENKGVLVEAEYDKIQFSNGNIVQLVKDGDVFYYDFSSETFIK